ncbi:hypothetical protein ACFWDA_09915 [Rhodococcus zopfii]
MVSASNCSSNGRSYRVLYSTASSVSSGNASGSFWAT